MVRAGERTAASRRASRSRVVTSSEDVTRRAEEEEEEACSASRRAAATSLSIRMKFASSQRCATVNAPRLSSHHRHHYRRPRRAAAAGGVSDTRYGATVEAYDAAAKRYAVLFEDGDADGAVVRRRLRHAGQTQRAALRVGERVDALSTAGGKKRCMPPSGVGHYFLSGETAHS